MKEDGGGENKFGGERPKRDKTLESGRSGEHERTGVRGVSVDDGAKAKLGLESQEEKYSVPFFFRGLFWCYAAAVGRPTVRVRAGSASSAGLAVPPFGEGMVGAGVGCVWKCGFEIQSCLGAGVC